MWMVRAGEDGFLLDEFQNKSIVAIGWDKIKNASDFKSKEEIKQVFSEKYPEKKKHQNIIGAGQFSRFVLEFKKGDRVLSYNKDKREYLVGEIQSDYEYNPALSQYHHIRRVKWLGVVNRDKLSTTTRNTLGAISTIFEIKDQSQTEILEVLKGNGPVNDDVENVSEEETLKQDMVSRAHELIKDKLLALDWDEMQRLVAGVLRAMGYKTVISKPGPDRGKDIEASPDGLMLLDPKIIVEVKHRMGQMGSKEVRNFISVVRDRHVGVYVSTGGFSKDAKTEAERANVQISVVDADRLVELLVEYYDNFDAETKLLVPLAKIYWPT